MNRFLQQYFILLLWVIFIISCSSNDNNGSGQPPQSVIPDCSTEPKRISACSKPSPIPPPPPPPPCEEDCGPARPPPCEITQGGSDYRIYNCSISDIPDGYRLPTFDELNSRFNIHALDGKTVPMTSQGESGFAVYKREEGWITGDRSTDESGNITILIIINEALSTTVEVIQSDIAKPNRNN